jgi:ABC-type polysaccharide/polyol phosphate transport system ATPase subunit
MKCVYLEVNFQLNDSESTETRNESKYLEKIKLELQNDEKLQFIGKNRCNLSKI